MSEKNKSPRVLAEWDYMEGAQYRLVLCDEGTDLESYVIEGRFKDAMGGTAWVAQKSVEARQNAWERLVISLKVGEVELVTRVT